MLRSGLVLVALLLPAGAAEAQPAGPDDRISSFTTRYPCCQPRVTNIKRAAALLDGTVIRPGGMFSMNAALGRRTRARGFVAAPQISGGLLVDSVGGGISQVATTIYNAAFLAGLELVEHTPHSFYISRYPKGREATISWGGPELVIRNDWEAPARLRVRTSDTAITVSVFSSRLGRRIEAASGEPYRYERPGTMYVVNYRLPPGARRPVQPAGGPGFSISYTRAVFQHANLRRRERFRVRYDPVHAVVEVGPERGGP